MFRRTFLKLALLGEFLLSQTGGGEEPSYTYTYDWSRNAVDWTDDPKLRGVGPILGANRQRVFLDGKDVTEELWTVRLKTGPNGWIESQDRTSDGHLQYTTGLWDNWNNCPVVLRANQGGPRFQCYDPARKDAKGNLLPRYEEVPVKVKTVLLRGHVRYVVL